MSDCQQSLKLFQRLQPTLPRASRPDGVGLSNPLDFIERSAMSLKLVTPGDRRPSRTKSIALALFSGVRTAQRVAAQVPVVAKATAQEIGEAWRESGAPPAKNA